jgi:V8-like Glu-specific endopeptidase
LDLDWLSGKEPDQHRGFLTRSPTLPSIEGPLETQPPPLPPFSYSDERPAPATRAPRFNALREMREAVPAEKLQFIPWLAICQLDVTYKTGRRALATGFLIDPILVATSGHVVHHPDPRYGFADAITVTPGFQQPRERRKSHTSRDFAPNRKWGADANSFLGALDYAVIAIADRNVFKDFHFLQWGQPDSLDASRRFTLSGYPAGKFGQWRHTDGIVG